MISKLFMERSRFILIGLTGRTGSGCTTAANILESKNPVFPELSSINYKGKPFYSGLDGKRYKILKNYTSENIDQFFSIKVSDLISAYLLCMSKEHAAKFIASTSEKFVDENDVYNILSKGVFSNNKITIGFKELIPKLLDHSKNLNISENEKNKFISFLKLIRKFTNEFKKELKELNNDLYISTYQGAGNSIRRIGRVEFNFERNEFSPDNVFHLPETINRVIKIIRKIKHKALIVIDAIRNPYEARFFKERYSAFYLVSINAPDEDRKTYLQNVHKYTIDKFDDIEKRESGKTSIDDADFISQNVKRCIETSDIHIFNPRNELENNNVLKAQLAWYVALMLHPGLVSPTSMERVMQIAYTAKSNSGCISRQVGAVITDNNCSIKAIGWNDVPKGQIPCSLRSLDSLIHEFDDVTYSQYELNNKDFRNEARKHLGIIKTIEKLGELGGRNISYCFKDLKNSFDFKDLKDPKKGNQVHTRSLHAEENAFLQLTKYGSAGIEGGKLYTTASPCELCAKKAYQLGIKEIVFIDPYPGIAKEHILSIGSNPPKLVQFRGAVGKGYHQLYEPTLPYKDELGYLTNS
jgi:deoxycytidylate deaminase